MKHPKAVLTVVGLTLGALSHSIRTQHIYKSSW